jgi:leucyl aminopeptidase
MLFKTTTKNIAQVNTDCLLLAIDANKQLTPAGEQINEAAKGYLQQQIDAGNVSLEAQTCSLLTDVPHIQAKRVLLISYGDQPISLFGFRKIINACFAPMRNLSCEHIVSALQEIPVKNHAVDSLIGESVSQFMFASYQFNAFKTQSKTPVGINAITFAISHENSDLEALIHRKYTTAQGVKLARDLGNTPPNICTPNYLAETARTLAKTYDSLSVDVIDENQAAKAGMGAFFAVSKGSAETGNIITLHYHGADKNTQPIALVGKGITFDAGGLFIKSSKGMRDMKYDMCGAACVFGVIKACAEEKLPINLIAMIPTAENMVSANATHPGDVIKTLSGITVEITNTDAEGRLILCSALSYVQQQFNPSLVIDVATLTGAAVVSLGLHKTVLMANNQPLADELLQAGLNAEDHAWQLPLTEEYQECLESNVADIVNWPGTPDGASITAACFLSRFTKDIPWAHLDNAGTGTLPGKQTSASGRPVALLMQFLYERAKQHAAN